MLFLRVLLTPKKTFYLIIVVYSSSYHNLHEFLVHMALKWQEIEFMQVFSSLDSFQSMPEILYFLQWGNFHAICKQQRTTNITYVKILSLLNILNL